MADKPARNGDTPRIDDGERERIDRIDRGVRALKTTAERVARSTLSIQSAAETLQRSLNAREESLKRLQDNEDSLPRFDRSQDDCQ